MKALCCTTDNNDDLVFTSAHGNTPEQCAVDAVRQWLDDGRLVFPTTDVGHGIYTVRVDIEIGVSEVRRKEGGDA